MRSVPSIVCAVSQSESTIDFDAHLTGMVFTSGCNFRCAYCHNCALWERRSHCLSEQELASKLKRLKENWVDAICITGGEPTVHETLPELVKRIKSMGFIVKLDTNGSRPDLLKQLSGDLDYIAMDFKSSLGRYAELTNVDSDFSELRESLDWLKSGSVDYELRTTVLPNIHHPEEMKRMCGELRGIKRYYLQAFVPKEKLLDSDFIRIQRTDQDYLNKLKQICTERLPGCDIRIR